jgi:hypothetical protein
MINGFSKRNIQFNYYLKLIINLIITLLNEIYYLITDQGTTTVQGYLCK